MNKFWFWIVILLGIHLFFLINLQFTAWPEMLAYPYLRESQFLIYKDMIHPYPPLLTMVLSWFYYILGHELWVLKMLAWAVILTSDILIFLITKQLTHNNIVAILTLFIYILLQPFLDGNMLWFDLAIIPPILLGTLFILRGNIFLAGLALSVAIFIKQTAIIFFILAFLYLIFIKRKSFNQLSAKGGWASGPKSFLIGLLIFGIPLLIRLIQEGALGDFINWVIIYPLLWFGKFPGYLQSISSKRELIVLGILFFPLAFLWRRRKILKDKDSQLILLFFLASLIAIYPRFSFFHFQIALAFLVILYGILLSKIKISSSTIAYFLVPSALLLFFVHRSVITLEWGKEARFYGRDELALADLISQRVAPAEKVFLLGLPANLYVMSNRLPPKRWTDNFGWYLEIPGVQREIISRWEENLPAQAGLPQFIFWRIPSQGNWFDLGTYQPQKIVKWIKDNYTKIEEVTPGIWLWEKKPVLSE
ncbi:hypothetical protein HY404_00750 [Candidatus Microgenomates bacterium]|nr:hypothetical protein [Candidatus Microgenomates bacterium]